MTLVSWNPEVVRGPLKTAFRPSVVLTQQDAQARAMAAKAKGTRIVVQSATTQTAFLRAVGPLAAVTEGGRQGGYLIAPKSGDPMFVGNGRFASGPVQGGPMAARPFLHPAAGMFPSYFRRLASLAFARNLL